MLLLLKNLLFTILVPGTVAVYVPLYVYPHVNPDAAAFHLFVLFYEEPHLRRVFGASYEQYCLQVSRWLPLARGG